MFDIAWTEILIVATIAIIVVGPKELPGMLRAFGKTFGQIRRTAREFQSTFNEALRDAERQAGLDEVKKDIQSIDPTKELRKGIADTKKTLGGKVSDSAKSDPEKPAADPAPTNTGTSATATATTPTATTDADDTATPPVTPSSTTADPAPAASPAPSAKPAMPAQPTPAASTTGTTSARPKPAADSAEETPRAAAGVDGR